VVCPSGRQSLLGSHGDPLSGSARSIEGHDVRGERQEGLPSHPPKRTSGADRRSDHSSNKNCSKAHSSVLAQAKSKEPNQKRPALS
jgi:hypothetical protein